jgi:hypothetical protein
MKHNLRWFKFFTILVLLAFTASFTPRVAKAQGGNPPNGSAPTAAGIEAVKAFVGDNAVIIYRGRVSSSYAPDVITEIYYVDTDQYEVNVETGQVIQFGARPLSPSEQPRTYDTSNRYTPSELEAMAVSFIAKHAPEVNLNSLTPAHSNKEEINYFFRWEDASGKTLMGMRAFIQVGFSRGGDLLSYTNALGLPALAPTVSGDIVYSNGGNYWHQYGPSQYWYYVSGQGWCGKYSTCTPAYMQYTWAGNTLSNYAKWDNIDYAQYAI